MTVLPSSGENNFRCVPFLSSSFDWISKPSHVLFLEKKEPHYHLFVQISNPHFVAQLFKQVLISGCSSKTRSLLSNMNHSLAAHKMGLRANAGVSYFLHIKMEMESKKKEDKKEENNVVTPFIIGTALTNMMNETKMECVRRIWVEWEGGTSISSYPTINPLLAKSSSFWS